MTNVYKCVYLCFVLFISFRLSGYINTLVSNVKLAMQSIIPVKKTWIILECKTIIMIVCCWQVNEIKISFLL